MKYSTNSGKNLSTVKVPKKYSTEFTSAKFWKCLFKRLRIQQVRGSKDENEEVIVSYLSGSMLYVNSAIFASGVLSAKRNCTEHLKSIPSSKRSANTCSF